MSLVREYIEFEQGKDPKRAMGIGKFYEIWRDEHQDQPIIKITANLSRFGTDEALIEVLLYYKRDTRVKRGIEISEDILSFEENKMGAVGLKPENYFPEPDEYISYDNPESFNKEIIDILSDQGDNGARKIIEEYISEWWEDERGLDQILREWVKSAAWSVDDVEVEYLK